MKFKPTLKNIVLLISTCIILFIAVFLITLGALNRKPLAGFYGLPEKTVDAITQVLNSTYQRKNKKSAPFEYVVLDSEKSLEYALKGQRKPDILFMYSGENANYAAKIASKRKTGLDSSILNKMTNSVKGTAILSKNLVTGVPLLSDNYEIAFNMAKAKSSGIDNVLVWSEIQTLAQKTKSSTMAPIIFPAADDIDFVNFMGALLESVSGIDAYNRVVEKIQVNLKTGKTSTQSFQNLVTEMFSIDGEFYETGKMIQEWKKYELLPKNFLQLSNRDVKAFMASPDSLTTVAFMTLSQHRTFDHEVISKYDTSFIPSVVPNIERTFTSPTVLAIPLSKNKYCKKGIQELAGAKQSSLSSLSGLAPVVRDAGIPDKQADDARWYVAASNTPVAGLAQVFTTKNTRAAFADALRYILR